MESGDRARDRRLAAPRLAYQSDALTPPKGEADIRRSHHHFSASSVLRTEIADLQKRRGRPLSAHCSITGGGDDSGAATSFGRRQRVA